MNAKPTRRGQIVLGTIIAQMGLGTIYTWSLFNQPLVDIFGWGRSAPGQRRFPSPVSAWRLQRCLPENCRSALAFGA